MDQRFRRGFTAAEKTQLWDRWQRGELLKAIGRAFGKPSSSIYYQVAPHGGIRPPPRRRSRLALTLAEREEISRGIAAHQSARSMARLLGRSASTVSRELKRNGGYDGYRAALADETAWARARRPKRCKLANSARLRQAVASKLRLNWSPEQVAGWRAPIWRVAILVRRAIDADADVLPSLNNSFYSQVSTPLAMSVKTISLIPSSNGGSKNSSRALRIFSGSGAKGVLVEQHSGCALRLRAGMRASRARILSPQRFCLPKGC